MYKLFSLFLLRILFLVFLSSNLSTQESFIPDPPSLNANNFILLDSVSGRILAEKGADERIEPASITKIMTGYVAADQIEKGFVNLDDEVFISENCWRKEGSKMFIREGTKVLMSDLMKGMVIQSGNDASCAIAEHVAASEEGFVQLMSLYVNELGLSNTKFTNVTGLPNEDHYSSARDLARLSMKLIERFPDHYALYKEKYFTYNNIKQRNRNSLLWQDDSIDGMKTGHTTSAGYCLVSSGVRNDTRLIAVTLKSSTEKSRLTDNRRLLDYGFRYFRTKKILTIDSSILEEQVWGGEKEKVNLSSVDNLFLTLSPRDFQRVEPKVILADYLQAPLTKGQVVGSVNLLLDGNSIAEMDVVAMEDVKALGFFGRAWSNIKLLTYKFLIEE
ncbi:MAG: serine-type D-Ala-D-Ala carboxypeptidase [Gammaproteobacteria bacterium]|nr:serine-type D-Ala-D-Ala carboxypeptidase [Gammaproteobacteria bacterium]HJL95826.1 D-alanyl-D-alanine carboxypeptidase family protein [SAR86 cluster bacterium]|tara:strand:- start:17406 stop:18572 length:1167 start_codon:yes stop_codon:yes gene_type:complete